MHFIAMLGFTIPGQTILYNVPITIVSMLIAIVVVGIGLFIVSYGNGGWRQGWPSTTAATSFAPVATARALASITGG